MREQLFWWWFYLAVGWPLIIPPFLIIAFYAWSAGARKICYAFIIAAAIEAAQPFILELIAR
jgi:hypothetical protein